MISSLGAATSTVIPELLYEVHRTAATVAEKLRSFGVDEVTTGIGRTGVVGVIRRNGGFS
jgi:hippurate hydrolase